MFLWKRKGDVFPVMPASASTCSPWQLVTPCKLIPAHQAQITSATVKLQFSLYFNQNLYIDLEIASQLRDITWARTMCREVFEHSCTSYLCRVFGRQLLQTSHLLLISRLPEQMTGAAVTCSAVAGPMLICLEYVGPPCSGVIFTPPRARLAGSVPIRVT